MNTPRALTRSEQAFVIATNLSYTAAGIAVLVLGQTMLHAALAIALGLLAGSSWRYHDSLKEPDLLLDLPRSTSFIVQVIDFSVSPPPRPDLRCLPSFSL